MNKYLNIPKNILIGQRANQAFITYKNGSNKIAKESTWTSWVGEGKKSEVENSPLSGFKLKDCIGGRGGSWYSFERRAWAIVTDPRGFDVEITFDNLVWIMKYYSHDVNKGFDGQLAYGWDGAQLMLVPTITEDYKYTKKVDEELKNYKLKDCVVGETYKFPNEDPMIYLGYLPLIYNKVTGEYENKRVEFSKKKHHCFRRVKRDWSWNQYETLTSTKKFLIKLDKETVSEDLINKYISEMNEYFWSNENFEEPINIIRIEPNDELIANNENRINQLKKFIEAPYKAHKNKYGYWEDNCKCEFGIYVFNKERTKVTKYYMGTETTYNGLNRSDYVSKRRHQVAKEQKKYYYDINPDEFDEEFNKNAIRKTTCHAGHTFKLIGNNIIQKETLREITSREKDNTLVSDLLNLNKGNIFITKSYFDNLNKVSKLVNESGFEFTIGEGYNC